MRVMWFTHLPVAAINRHMGRKTRGTGFWIHSLVEPLMASGQVELAIGTATPGDPAFHFEEDGVRYFNVADSKTAEVYGMFRQTRLRRMLRQCAEKVRQWKPDVIHVHGTERPFGLMRARELIDVPTLVSIQGLIEQVYHYDLGVMSMGDLLRNMTWFDLTHTASPLMARRRHGRHIPIEREVIRGADGIIGRTAWDHAHTRALNPEAPYFHIDEMMRPEFRQSQAWSVKNAEDGVIMTTSGKQPLKGLPVLLEAVAILRQWGHAIRLKVAGVSSGDRKFGVVKFLLRRIGELDLTDAIELLGWQAPSPLVQHQHKARCFVTPSLIENSSNGLSEAQLLGLPCVASHTGGLSTLVRDEQTGLLFSPGDAAMLASQIERLLTNDELARRLGEAARQAALQRHDPDRIVNDLLACYQRMSSANGAV